MKTAELIKLLKKHGVYLLREGGRHSQYYCPPTGKVIMIWRHAKEVPTGTANAILKDAGLK